MKVSSFFYSRKHEHLILIGIRTLTQRMLFSVLMALVCFVSCTEDEYSRAQIPPSGSTSPSDNVNLSGTNFSFLALGDSYTIGQGVDEKDRWPSQLKSQLSKKSINLSPVEIIAQTGWTTNDLLRAINERNPKQFELVSLLIGVNNQYQKKPFSQFEIEFEKLLDVSIGLAGRKERVFVVSIPDYGVTPFGSGNPSGIAADINGYNGYLQQRCFERGVVFIDITDISREMGSTNGALAGDRLHPSGQQYAKWLEKILPEVINLLSN